MMEPINPALSGMIVFNAFPAALFSGSANTENMMAIKINERELKIMLNATVRLVHALNNAGSKLLLAMVSVNRFSEIGSFVTAGDAFAVVIVVRRVR